MDVTYNHIQFLYRDRVKYREMTEEKFNKFIESTAKKIIQLEGD